MQHSLGLLTKVCLHLNLLVTSTVFSKLENFSRSQEVTYTLYEPLNKCCIRYRRRLLIHLLFLCIILKLVTTTTSSQELVQRVRLHGASLTCVAYIGTCTPEDDAHCYIVGTLKRHKILYYIPYSVGYSRGFAACSPFEKF